MTYIHEIRELLAASDFKPIVREPEKVKTQVKLLTPEEREKVDRVSGPHREGFRYFKAEMMTN